MIAGQSVEREIEARVEDQHEEMDHPEILASGPAAEVEQLPHFAPWRPSVLMLDQ
jgi:hypothetical protein